jgi:hypothetical protein
MRLPEHLTRAAARARAQVMSVERIGGGHLKVVLSNGRFVITSATPSDWRAALNLAGCMRRELKHETKES